MTIILGRRPQPQPTSIEVVRAEWVDQFRTGHVARGRLTVSDDDPAPVPGAEIHSPVRGALRTAPGWRACPRDGVVGLYATRLDSQQARRLRPCAPQQPDPRVPSVVARPAKCVGRGTAAHYQAQHPHLEIAVPRPTLPARPRLRLSAPNLTAMPRAVWDSAVVWLKAWQALGSGATRSRMAGSRRAVLASMAALMLVAGMATSTFAAGSQMRYEVQPGDTLDSLAAEFGVDPEAIYRSSYMPNGTELVPGQVIIIPEVGQSPEDAAAMAAAREGTSPWVVGAHVVEYGDTFAGIAAAWDVNVDALMAFNPGIDPTQLIPGERILIPWDRDTETASTAVTTAPVVSIAVPNYTQTRNLSCEYAATHAATAAFGTGIPEWTFMESVPQAANPHNGYRGNIDGLWGNTDDYGVYAEALVPVLNANGYGGDVMYTGGDTGPLVAQLDAGRPVVVWLGFWGDTREVKSDDGTYSVFAGMHVVTVTGYDESGVFVMDPAKGIQQHYDWATFQQLWSVVDGMGLAVYPL